jgi:hypothetical protein
MFPKARVEVVIVEKTPLLPLVGNIPLHYTLCLWAIPPHPTFVHTKLGSPCVCNLLLGHRYYMHNKFGHCCASYNIVQEMHVYRTSFVNNHLYHDLHINLY